MNGGLASSAFLAVAAIAVMAAVLAPMWIRYERWRRAVRQRLQQLIDGDTR